MKNITGEELAMETFRAKLRAAGMEDINVLRDETLKTQLCMEMLEDIELYDRLISEHKSKGSDISGVIPTSAADYSENIVPFNLAWLEAPDTDVTAGNIRGFTATIETLPGYGSFWDGFSDFFWKSTSKVMLQSVIGLVIMDKPKRDRNWITVSEILEKPAQDIRLLFKDKDLHNPLMYQVPFWINCSDNLIDKIRFFLAAKLDVRERYKKEIASWRIGNMGD